MTKISNQTAYIPDTDINGKDYLLGTDIDKSKNTSNFRVEDLGKYFNSTNGLRSFDFEFYQHIGISPTPVDGQFYSNDNNTNPYLINHFIVSKKTKSNLDVYSFFQDAVAENPFNLLISQNTNISTVFYFRIESIEIDPNYIKLNVSRLFYPENKELEFKLSFNTFNFKPPVAIVATYTDEEAQDAVGNILIDSDTVDLEYDDNVPSIKATVIPGSITSNELANNIPTSEFINNGADGTSTYVEADELSTVATTGNYSDLSGIPSTFPPSTHTHTQSEVTGLVTDLSNKEPSFTKNTGFNKNFGTTAGTVVEGNDSRLSDARTPTAHNHVINDTTGLQTALDSKASTSHTHTEFAKVNLDSTTIISGTGVSINADPTKFNINVTGKIVNPTTFVATPITVNQTGILATYRSTQPESYIWIDISGTVIQSLTPPASSIFDSILGFWVIVHSNLVSLNVVNDFAMFTDSVGTQLLQSLDFDGFRKKKGSNIVSAGTTGTRLTHSGGLAIKAGGGGFATRRPIITLNGAVDSNLRMRMRDDSEGSDTQTMGVTNYDLNGVLTTLANNKFTAHKVWKFSSSIIRVQRGQKQYDNIDSAISGINLDTYIDMPNGSKNGIHIGWVIFKKGTSWGSGGIGVAGVDYKFIDVNLGSGGAGSTGAIPTFQGIYNVSTQPQITTEATKGALQIKGGTGVDTDNIFEGKNNAGTITSYIKADGTSSFQPTLVSGTNIKTINGASVLGSGDLVVGVPEEDFFTYFKGDMYFTQATGATLTNIGGANPALVGTGSNYAANFAADYSTAPYTTWNGRRQSSAGTAGSSGEAYRSENKICSVGLGFYRSGKVSTVTSTNSRCFFGLNDSLAAMGNVNPSTLFNIVGFGRDSGDTNLQIIHNDNAGTATKVDLGASFAVGSVNAFLYEFWNFKGSNTCYFRIKNLITNVTSSIITITTDLPTVNDGLTTHDWLNNGTDAVQVYLYFSNILTKRQS